MMLLHFFTGYFVRITFFTGYFVRSNTVSGTATFASLNSDFDQIIFELTSSTTQCTNLNLKHYECRLWCSCRGNKTDVEFVIIL